MENNSQRQILTISQLNFQSKRLLESHFPLIWVEGEISNFTAAYSGHWYFSLKDEKAQIRCAMFRQNNQRAGFRPENGQKIIVRARISLYEPRGDYQLICDSMEAFGDGLLLKQFEALKQKLASQGLFSQELKKPIPQYPTTIGIISSASGAAIHDIMQVLKRRAPFLRIIIYPSQVQGTEAPAQLRQALAIAIRRNECDTLILTRGGGSLEDLNGFNDEQLAHDILACPIPIISAVGHEVDFTISDFVADFRAPTPSAAAEIASFDQDQWLAWLIGMEGNLSAAISNYLQAKEQLVDWHFKQLKHPSDKLAALGQRLSHLNTLLQKAMTSAIFNQQRHLEQTENRLFAHHPGKFSQLHQVKLEQLEQRLLGAMKQSLVHKQEGFEAKIRELNALSPLATMARGYAIVKTKGEKSSIVHQASTLATNDEIEVSFEKDSLIAKVTEINAE